MAKNKITNKAQESIPKHKLPKKKIAIEKGASTATSKKKKTQSRDEYTCSNVAVKKKERRAHHGKVATWTLLSKKAIIKVFERVNLHNVGPTFRKQTHTGTTLLLSQVS